MQYKIIIIMFALTLCPSFIKAQLNKVDSLKLNRLLKGNKEIKINQKELENIQFDNHIINNPILKPLEIKRLNVDETLPEDAKKIHKMTLTPYKVDTPYNWDPVYHCKIIQHANGKWVPQYVPRDIVPSDSIPIDSLASEVARERFARTWRLHGGRIMMLEGAIDGIDLMRPFEKGFWQFRENRNRKRTLEVLKDYGKAQPQKLQNKKK
jgi:hypothetical protein